MLNNYLKIAFRNLKKNKVYTFINMSGLAIGMAIFILITIYSSFELSYNKFHEKSEQIFQISIDDDFSTTAPLAPLIKGSIPDFEKIVRIDDNYGGGSSPLFIVDVGGSEKKVKVKDVLYVDDTFFDIFSFQVIHGNPKTSLVEPNSLVLTQSTSQRLFGVDNSIGKTIHYIGSRNGKPELDMIVTAIVEDPPNNSTITFNALASFSTMYTFRPKVDNDWANWGYKTCVLLNEQNANSFRSNLNNTWQKRCAELWPGEKIPQINAIPFSDVPFYKNSRQQLIYFLQLIGIFILAAAIINFINLTIAKSAARAKEIGIRKVIGSLRFELIKQFMCESMLISLIVAPIAILIVLLMKAPFYNIINKEIPFDLLHQPSLILFLFVGAITIGLIAGIYPALYLSSFSPASIIKGEITKGKKRNTLRFSLFVFQFFISACLVISTIVITKQIEFLKSKPLGFDNSNIIHCPQSKEINNKYDVFKNRLLQNSNVISVARSNHELGKDFNISVTHEVDGEKEIYSATTVDPDFIPTMKIEILEGRGFSWEISSDKYEALVVNESFVKEFELESPIGTEIDMFDWKAKIIGVFKDFHNDSFHELIKPSALMYADWNGRINIKLNANNTSQTLNEIEKVWSEISPITTFEYEFLDDTYNNLYKSEEELQKIISYFSIVAIIIACLGLFGLISYSTEQRTKEIGIRKVLGASIGGLVGLLSQEYVRWVLVANLIAWPIAYLVLDNWLQNFPYRISITPWPFLFAGLAALAIALATISFQAIKTATANPVDSLRNE